MRGAHQTLEFAAGIRRVRVQETARARTNDDIAARIDADHAWRQHAALVVADERHLFAVKRRDGRIGRAQIDADVERPRCHGFVAFAD
jgi:hypothetical protein